MRFISRNKWLKKNEWYYDHQLDIWSHKAGGLRCTGAFIRKVKQSAWFRFKLWFYIGKLFKLL